MDIFNSISNRVLWFKYEKQVLSKIRDKFSTYEFTLNDKIMGRLSKVVRQIDISLRKQVDGKIQLGVVECKCFGSKIDVKLVDSFIGFLDDVNAQFGMMITNKGFSKGAQNRASGEGIQLDIIKFSDWDAFNFSWIDDQMTISTDNLIIRCDRCNQKMIFRNDELPFEVVEEHERGMGKELYHYATWEGYCNNEDCNNLIRFSLEVIEYPLGFKTSGQEETHGCELIRRFDI